MWPRVRLLEHRLVQREPAVHGAGTGGRRRRMFEHHALLDLVVAGHEAVERGVEVGRLDLGEVAELADVDPEHRRRRPRSQRSTARSMVPSPPRLTDDVEAVGELRHRDRVATERSPASASVPGMRTSMAARGEAFRGAGRQFDRRPGAAGAGPVRRGGCRAAGSRAGTPWSARRGQRCGKRRRRARRRRSAVQCGWRAPGTRRCRRRRGRRRPCRATTVTPGPERVTTRPSTHAPQPGSRDDARPCSPRARPASNCGFTSSTRSPPGGHAPSSAAHTVRSEMNDRSATASVDRPSDHLGSRSRTLVRSRTDTRDHCGSARAAVRGPRRCPPPRRRRAAARSR